MKSSFAKDHHQPCDRIAQACTDVSDDLSTDPPATYIVPSLTNKQTAHSLRKPSVD